MEVPLLLILLIFALGIAVFYPDIIAKILAVVIIFWAIWHSITE